MRERHNSSPDFGQETVDVEGPCAFDMTFEDAVI